MARVKHCFGSIKFLVSYIFCLTLIKEEFLIAFSFLYSKVKRLISSDKLDTKKISFSNFVGSSQQLARVFFILSSNNSSERCNWQASECVDKTL